MNIHNFVSNPRRTGSTYMVIALMVGLVVASTVAQAAGTASPHWRKGSCQSCHESPQPITGQAQLKSTSAQSICEECHNGRAAPDCRHRSGFAPETARVADFDEHLQAGLDEGKVVCTTCHDMTPHCALDVKQRYRNTSFLRNGPYDNTSDQCFGCHSKSGYRQRSPHMHISKGVIKEGHCMFCHQSTPQRDASGQWLPVQFGTDGPLSQLCSGCHMIGPHPSGSVSGKTGWFHMVVPPPAYAERMQQSVATRGGSLPLDPNTGEITCATCHNPHNRKLEAYPLSGEKTKTKLRYENMCGVCHEK